MADAYGRLSRDTRSTVSRGPWSFLTFWGPKLKKKLRTSLDLDLDSRYASPRVSLVKWLPFNRSTTFPSQFAPLFVWQMMVIQDKWYFWPTNCTNLFHVLQIMWKGDDYTAWRDISIFVYKWRIKTTSSSKAKAFLDNFFTILVQYRRCQRKKRAHHKKFQRKTLS